MRQSSLGLALPLMLGAAICWPGRVDAADDFPGIEGSAFSFQGFGTLGAARSTNGDAHVLRNIRQPEGIGRHWSVKQDSLLGLQVQYNFNDRVSALAQGTSYLREDGSFEPDITAAFLKFDLTPRFSVKLGRIGLDLLMLNDTRMVGYSYIPIRPTSEAYNVPANYVDGANARWRFPVGEGVLSLDASAGIARENLPAYKVSGSKMMKGAIGYELGSWQFRYFYSRANLKHESSTPELRGGLDLLEKGIGLAQMYGFPELASQAIYIHDKVSAKDTWVVYESLGAGYDDGVWQMQAVFDIMRYEIPIMTSGKVFHFILGRRMGDVTPYVGYSRIRTKPRHLQGLAVPGMPDIPVVPPWHPMYDYFESLRIQQQELVSMVGAVNAGVDYAMRLSSQRMDSETYTLGMRWDFRRNMALKAQVDYLRGGRSVSSFVTDTKPDWNGKATMFSVSLDFVF